MVEVPKVLQGLRMGEQLAVVVMEEEEEEPLVELGVLPFVEERGD